ncbi:MAG: family 10 glycosylhydrolase, partial [Clostridia bacterium]|nr:family 10 glycosylhydrolase [Clostridia bacterium]
MKAKATLARALRSALLTLLLLFPLLAAPPSAAAAGELRGVWIATVYSIDFPHTKTQESQKQELIDILDTAEEAGLNAVFFQVRPTGDAYYRSAHYPWAASLTGTAGQDPGWDPLQYLIDQATPRGIEIHAWINPYRLTEGSADKPNTDIASLPETHPVRQNPAMAVAFDDGKLYLDPGHPAAMQLVVDGVTELVENYDIAGIHFDDYFYPTPSVTRAGKTYTAVFDDADTYAAYGNGLSLADWRRSNTEQLVRKVAEAVHTADPDCRFGIAPSGIWRNAKNDSKGSDTNGFESYSSIYADTRGWVKQGLLDYICPQLYWRIGQKGSDYAILAEWWADVCKDTGVDLYIGHAAYRIGESSAWEDPLEFARQLALNKEVGGITGDVYYGYSKLESNAFTLKDTLHTLYVEGKNPLETVPADGKPSDGKPQQGSATVGETPVADRLIIAAPTSGYSTSAGNSFIIGAGDPAYPILVNGREIKRTKSGYFALFEPLKVGTNTFTFEHKGTTRTFTIKRTAGGGGGSGAGNALNGAAFVKGSLFPTANSRYAPGERFILTCIAPDGATVTAKLGGLTYQLEPEAIVSTKGKVASRKYATAVTMTAQPGLGLINVGTPSYTLVYEGETVTQSAPASVFCYM